MNDAWIDRVKAADAEAEAAYGLLYVDTVESTTEKALLAIAAELRAQRISRRSGAGQ